MNVTNTTTLAGNIGQANDMLSRSLLRLSSGTSFLGAGDNPAGQADAASYDSQAGRIQSASTNVQNALSYAQAADGYLGSMQQILSRMGMLATEAKDPTKTASDVSNLSVEFSALQDQLRSTIGGPTSAIGGTADVTAPAGAFNGVALFGSAPAQDIGAGAGTNDTIALPQLNLQQGAMAAVIGQDGSGNFSLGLTDPSTVSTLDSAVQQVGGVQGQNSASEARLQIAAATLQVESQNISSVVSSIGDTNIAAESTQLAKAQILEQAGTAMLSHANLNSATIYKLLG